MDNLKEYAKAQAKANYEKSYGWSVFTECFDDNDFAEMVEDLDTIEQVKNRMDDMVSVWDDKYENARIEGDFQY